MLVGVNEVGIALLVAAAYAKAMPTVEAIFNPMLMLRVESPFGGPNFTATFRYFLYFYGYYHPARRRSGGPRLARATGGQAA
jgi:hypothetical protein